VTIVDDDALALVVSTSLVRVPESGSTSFNVQLNGSPGPGGANAVAVSFARLAGDADLRVVAWASPPFSLSGPHAAIATNSSAGPRSGTD
jgi:hypothetical protein